MPRSRLTGGSRYSWTVTPSERARSGGIYCRRHREDRPGGSLAEVPGCSLRKILRRLRFLAVSHGWAAVASNSFAVMIQKPNSIGEILDYEYPVERSSRATLPAPRIDCEASNRLPKGQRRIHRSCDCSLDSRKNRGLYLVFHASKVSDRA